MFCLDRPEYPGMNYRFFISKTSSKLIRLTSLPVIRAFKCKAWLQFRKCIIVVKEVMPCQVLINIFQLPHSFSILYIYKDFKLLWRRINLSNHLSLLKNIVLVHRRRRLICLSKLMNRLNKLSDWRLVMVRIFEKVIQFTIILRLNSQYAHRLADYFLHRLVEILAFSSRSNNQ